MLLRPEAFRDRRGFLVESYRREAYAAVGVEDDFVQDNHSRSRRGVVRGMHFQAGEGMAKLVRCARGSVMDVVVDLRPGSETFGQWEAYELGDESLVQLYCPIGFAHGFCVRSEVADVLYKCSSYYRPDLERTIAWDDPDVGIEWPAELELVVSERDAGAPGLREIASELGVELRA